MEFLVWFKISVIPILRVVVAVETPSVALTTYAVRNCGTVAVPEIVPVAESMTRPAGKAGEVLKVTGPAKPVAVNTGAFL